MTFDQMYSLHAVVTARPAANLCSGTCPCKACRVWCSGSDAEARPGVMRLIDEARQANIKVAVCSAATKSSVIHVVKSLLGEERFQVQLSPPLSHVCFTALFSATVLQWSPPSHGPFNFCPCPVPQNCTPAILMLMLTCICIVTHTRTSLCPQLWPRSMWLSHTDTQLV